MPSAQKHFIGTMRYTILKNELDNRVNSFKRYLEYLERDFESKSQKINYEYNLKEPGSSREDYESAEFMRKFLIYREVDIHIEILRKSLAISIYSFLEHHMNLICNHLDEFHSSSLTLKDLKGDGIKRAKLHLEKVHSLDFSKLNSCWSFLSNFNKVRNCLVHTDGDTSLMRSKTTLVNVVDSSDGLSLIKEKQIKIEKDYIHDCIYQMGIFLTKIVDDAFGEYNLECP